MKPSSGDEPLKELKHDAVPGYGKAFAIAFGVMTLYLAIILLSSPGPAEGHHGHGDKAEHSHEEHGSEKTKSH